MAPNQPRSAFATCCFLMFAVLAPQALAIRQLNQVATTCFSATVDGQQQVPINNNVGGAHGTFKMMCDETQCTYVMDTTSITDWFASHLHMGPPGQNGAPFVSLLPLAPIVNGTIPVLTPANTVMGQLHLTSSFTATLVAPIPLSANTTLTTIAQLVELAATNNVYVNHHTTAAPAGLIRGNLNTTPCTPNFIA